MIRPQDTATRETKRLDGLWAFALDPSDAGVADRWFARPLPGDTVMAVPASFNDIGTDAAVRDHVGPVWYQRTVRVPRGWADGRVTLYVGSATHRASVWAGDVLVGSHEGGYLPFEVDLTEQAHPGEPLRLTIRVDNTLSFQTIPPGIVLPTPTGRTQKYWHDFFNYAGLHRSLHLVATPRTRVEDVTVVTGFDGATGWVDYALDLQGEGAAAATTRVSLTDETGQVVATGDGITGRLSIPQVTLWQPGAGYLYTLTVQVSDGERLLDEIEQRVGVRTVRIDGTRLLVNEEPVYLTGFGMHEDHQTIGKGHNDAFMLADLERLAWVGATSLRTSHYPYAEEVLDEADRRGILVIDETPAVGLNMGLGGGIMGAQGYTTFSAETVNDVTQQAHIREIRELVARDKNHPCVVVWSIANEPESETEAAEHYFEPLFDIARQADPQHRPVGFVNVMLAPHGQCRVGQFADILMLNRYYGWYADTGDLVAAEAHWREELSGWASEGKPVVVTEYGADTMPGLHQLPAQPWSEEYQVACLEMNHRVFDDCEAVVGEQVWNFADFVTTPGIMRVGGNKKGVFTRDRQPKAAAHYLRQRWTADQPYLMKGPTR